MSDDAERQGAPMQATSAAQVSEPPIQLAPNEHAKNFETAFKKAADAPSPPVPGIVRAKTFEEAFAAMKRADSAQTAAAVANPFASP